MNVESRLKGQATNIPPKEIPASELLQKLIAVGSPSEVLSFPRNDVSGVPLFQYRMRVLRQSEIDTCGARAEAHARRVFRGDQKISDAEIQHVRNEAWNDVYENAKITELLALACVEVDQVDTEPGKPRRDKPLFEAASRIRDLLTGDEIAALFFSYSTVQQKFGPLWRMLSEDEVDAWVDRLSQGLDAYPLSDLGHAELVQLALSLASRLSSLKTGTGSSGPPAASGIENESTRTGESE